MIRAVLDANVLVSALINPTGTPARLVALWRAERFTVVVSDALLRELYEVLHYPKLLVRHGWSAAQIRAFVGELAHYAIRTPGALTLTVIQDDPADNRYLECAVEGAADFLVTGDRLLLNLEAIPLGYCLVSYGETFSP
jgi:putative PIN family toxin of toxin-antitoxin system